MVEWGKLIFGGVDSSDYGIYISGEGVFNAPERAVELIDVPGRNGAVALDLGRYNNISVTYPAGLFGKKPENFRDALSAFRNAILSQKGYQRLEDTYHPEEFRMGLYADGLEVTPAHMNQAGQFELTFNCKPQRFLKIGDLPTPVDSGDILQNPTLFPSRPLLEIEGYGDISFNGYNISLENALIGNVEITQRISEQYQDDDVEKSIELDTNLFEDGDTITINPTSFTFNISSPPSMYVSNEYTIDGSSTITPTVRLTPNSLTTTITFPKITQAAEQAGNQVIKKAKVTVTYNIFGGGADTAVLNAQITIEHDKVTLKMSATVSSGNTLQSMNWNMPAIFVDSSVNILGHPTYIDFELGEAYRIVNDEYQSLNAYVALGSDLPVMSPGMNKVTFDNTITDMKIAPRWWSL